MRLIGRIDHKHPTIRPLTEPKYGKPEQPLMTRNRLDGLRAHGTQYIETVSKKDLKRRRRLERSRARRARREDTMC